MQISKKRELPRKCELKYCAAWVLLSDLKSLLGRVWQEAGDAGTKRTGTNRESCVHVCICARVRLCWGKRTVLEGHRTVSSSRAQERLEMYMDFLPNMGESPSFLPSHVSTQSFSNSNLQGPSSVGKSMNLQSPFKFK